MIKLTEEKKDLKIARNLWHCGAGIIISILYGMVSKEQAQTALYYALFVFAILEASRMFFPKWNDFLVDKALKYLFRPSERYRVNTSLWYIVGLVTIVFFFSKAANQIAILILAIGDPAAAIVGQLYGKTKIFREKSLEGSSVFVIIAFFCSFFVLAIINELSFVEIFFGALTIALVSGLTELLTVKVDDNFSIPVVSAAVAMLFV